MAIEPSSDRDGDMHSSSSSSSSDDRFGGSRHSSSLHTTLSEHRRSWADCKARSLRRSRILATLLLLAVTVAAGVFTYFWTRREALDDFETKSQDLAEQLLSGAERNMRSTAAHLRVMAAAVMAFAIDNHEGSSVRQSAKIDASGRTTEAASDDPDLFRYTHHRFASLSDNTRQLTGAAYLSWSPLVEGGSVQRNAWTSYAADNYPEWVAEGSQYEQADLVIGQPHPAVFYWDADRQSRIDYDSTHTGVYAPTWQLSPVAVASRATNLDILAHPAIQQSFRSMQTYVSQSHRNSDSDRRHAQVLSQTINASTFLPIDDAVVSEPCSVFLTPLFGTFVHSPSTGTNEPRKIMGLLSALFSWSNLLGNILPSDTPSMHVVLNWNGCIDGASGSEYLTYDVTGNTARYLGDADLHDTDMDKYRRQVDFVPDFTASGNDFRCSIRLGVYPTQELHNATMTDKPYISATIVVVVLFLVFIMFFVYDYMLQKDRAQTFHATAESNAKIASVIPPSIRDRLFAEDEQNDAVAKAGIDTVNRDKPKKQETVQQNSNCNSSSNNNNDDDNNTAQPFPESSRVKLRSYLNDEKTAANHSVAVPVLHATGNDSVSGCLREDGSTGNSNSDVVAISSTMAATIADVDVYETKPLADLFPNATVLFADIAGFTAWSSVREPTQVFTLLETVYRAFDAIAKRRRVFKVETVGDCYVAVVGLPEARDDHAIVMVRFAKECRTKFNELAKQLELTLGPDTGELGIRMGMHSGPVTAGVLRVDKSRFQLFGDTVNMAARIETMGLRNHIHLSCDTAKLLIDAGKEHWVRKRADTIVAKGKVSMQTYWLNDKDNTMDGNASDDGTELRHEANQRHVNEAAKFGDLTGIEESLPTNIRRLVNWNVEILKKLLKQIIAKRQETEAVPFDQEELRALELRITRNRIVLDEVVETISLPKYRNKSAASSASHRKIEIPDEVVEQLRLYVFTVAALHKPNAFHNFEHASHVTMSVSKLLSRIVAPDSVKNANTSGKDDMEECLHDHTYGITSDPLTQFAVVLSALVHDADHEGVSNMQLAKEDHLLSRVFRNKSTAEQHSIGLAWEKLMCSPFQALRRCIYSHPSELFRFRQIMVNTVLATDIFDKELQAQRRNRWDAAFRRWAREPTPAQEDVNRKATIVIEHLIQASDVSHTMQHWHVYQKWNERLFHEMTTAFRAGRMGKDPAVGWYQGELGFFDNYIIPLAKKLKECGVFGVSSDEYLNYALENRREWSAKGEEIVAKMIEKYKLPSDDDDDEKGGNGKEGSSGEGH